ncbi:hypothetical protein BP6252_10692 [Coleophoma cylindrospora]|uniref:Adenylosuccinate lyase C-terminal domain-containing protein n=1 Tax=Coleophoma cylindrospora TaxID=1849047 RepID=A0A3D8QTM8_9HELO|nr:hypothetical protein BP6252_10692 [Coleophoma cylindrospora]
MANVVRATRNVFQKSPHDVVLLSAVRSPITRGFKGGLKDAYPEDILMPVMKSAVERARISPGDVEDVLIGNVLAELGFAKTGRMALNHAGFPSTTTFHTVNRQCSSSLQALTHLSHSIMAGQISVAMAGGVESMSKNYETRGIPRNISPTLLNSDVKDSRDCLMPMGITSENVADRYGISRRLQDEYALESQRRAVDAQMKGYFEEEIVPIFVSKDLSTGDKDAIISLDDGVRPSVTLEKLSKLNPAFKKDGTSTAGNSSQISDGSSATIVARRSWVEERGLRPLGRFVGTQVKGCAPDEMGIGPTLAIPALYKYTGIQQKDVDLFEINEAFASQTIYCLDKLGLDYGKVNIHGGAIALGHPTGATGTRQVATLFSSLKRLNKEIGVNIVIAIRPVPSLEASLEQTIRIALQNGHVQCEEGSEQSARVLDVAADDARGASAFSHYFIPHLYVIDFLEPGKALIRVHQSFRPTIGTQKQPLSEIATSLSILKLAEAHVLPHSEVSVTVGDLPSTQFLSITTKRIKLRTVFTVYLRRETMGSIFDDNAYINRCIDAETALARAQSKCGVIPAHIGQEITARADSRKLDFERLSRETEIVGYPILPLVRQLSVACGEEAGKYLHWGATTQDIMDMASVLQMKEGLEVVERLLKQVIASLSSLAEKHKATPMAGRTHLQHALPVTFGYKCAVWLSGFQRHLERLEQLRPRALLVQFGGAAGTLASLGDGDDGLRVRKALAEELSLENPSITWHVARDGVAEIANFLALVGGTLGKVALDLIIMSSNELSEVAEPFVMHRGASSTMPQKRNPISSEVILAASKILRSNAGLVLDGMVADFERASGPWHLEWVAIPESFVIAVGALTQADFALSGLCVYSDNMLDNLHSTKGLIIAEAVMMGLAPHLGRQTAHDVVYEGCKECIEKDMPLFDCLVQKEEVLKSLPEDRLRNLCDPTKYLGACRQMVEDVLSLN